MSASRSHSPWHELSRDLPGIAAVAATYVFFLLYAQFAFLSLLQERLGTALEVERAMAAMGVAGLVVSLLTAALAGRRDPRRLLAWGFAGCAAAALASLGAFAFWTLAAAAAAIGGFTAMLTVALATSLRTLVPGRRFGLGVGLGTGLAYLVCNLQPIFEGSPALQSAVAAGACCAGLGAVRWQDKRPRPAPSPPEPSSPALSRGDFCGLGFASLILSFLALIWLDSAAFAIIQETAALKGSTWGSGGQKVVLGITHFLAAAAGGWLIDRGFFRSLLLAAFGLFAAAFTALGTAGFVAFGGPVYAVGISLYSVALVAYPAYRADGPGLVPRRWRAGIVFGVAGWLGSALGVGMAQSLHHIPALFLWAAGLLLAAGWLLASRGRRLAAAVRPHAVTLACGALGLAVYLLPLPAPGSAAGEPPEASAVERGRRVYIDEGCINCHSQYVRPHSSDPGLWGPSRRAAAGEEPPLYGNRRQGPDLTNVGSRRSAAWQKLHLEAPRSLVPESRMPSYSHLFAPGERRGDDLVAYLDSLGAGAREEWFELTRQASFGEAMDDGSPARGRRTFERYCAACHGVEGRGDGPLSAAVDRPAMNLRKGDLWLVSWGPGAEPVEQALARVVRFGVPGTSMPGHEYLTVGDVADVVAYVQTLLRADEARLASAGGAEG